VTRSSRFALVTGAAGDIGRAISAALHADGWSLGLIDLDAQRITEAPAGATLVSADVTNPESVAAALDRLGVAPDLVVNNAGIVRFGPLLEHSLSDFEAVLRVNLLAAFIVGQHCARLSVAAGKGGAIVNITSINGIVPGPNSGAYTAAKAGLALLTKQMALEWGPLGIRVNSIAPGLIDAGMSNAIHADRELRAAREARIPLRRLGTAGDVASLVVFLASDAASYITGENIAVDGGVTQSLLTMLPRPKSVDKVGPNQ
jgi:NAD(P)-dependent dehydrogenase (short-subunit alcohol dehydrogenase family)